MVPEKLSASLDGGSADECTTVPDTSTDAEPKPHSWTSSMVSLYVLLSLVCLIPNSAAVNIEII